MTKNRIHRFIFGSILLLCNASFSQTPSTILLNAADNGRKSYVATSEINFIPGYEYSTSSEFMEAYITHYIDATVYQTPYTSSTFNSIGINTGLTIGATNGIPNVSSSGAGNYTIPIQIPQGTNGVSPNISITYSSQQGNGLLGVGWGISGLSAITLTSSSWYYDGKAENIQLNGTDKFSFDGNRLIATTGTYGANNTIYSTEAENYTKIISYGAGLTPDWFQVQTKDGTTIEYGKSSDSKIVNLKGNAISWQINKVIDANGNYILFEYSNENFDTRINKISYTGNTSLVPYNYIKFNYKDREDKNVYYEAGSIYNANNILTSIDVYSENEHFKSYKFEYGLNINSFLKSITELGANNEPLNATNFKYGEKGVEFENISCSSFNGVNADFSVGGDYNGDGKSDLLVQYFTYSSKGVKIPINCDIFSATADNQFSRYAYGGTSSSYLYYLRNESAGNFISSLDYYGDGKDDLVSMDYSSTSLGIALNSIKISNILSSDTKTESYIRPSYSSGVVQIDRCIQIADFDGNGKDDILILKHQTKDDHRYFGELISKSDYNAMDVHRGVSLGAGLSNYMYDADEIKLCDIDGDNKKELMVIYNNNNVHQIQIYELISPLQADLASFQLISKYDFNGFFKIWLGDFNGDGKTDLLSKIVTSDFAILLSDGVNFIKQPFVFSTSPNLNGSLLISDINGDSKSDIICTYPTSTGSQMDVYYNSGTKFTLKSNTLGVISSFDDFTIGDFNGDGKYEIFNRDYYNSPSSIYYFNRNGQDLLLTDIKDGFGRATKFNYNWLSKKVNYIDGTVATTTSFPVYDGAKSLAVISSIDVPDGVGGISSTFYTYQDAKWHKQGKGFLGFSKITSNNSITGITNTQNFTLNMSYGLFILNNQTNALTTNNQILTKKTYLNQITSLGGLRFKMNLSSLTEEDLINTITSTTTFLYDINGNTTSITKSNGIETAVTTNVFSSFGSWWIPSKLTSTTSTITRTGETPFSRTINYNYSITGNLNQEITDPNLPKAVTKSYLYDLYGNCIQTSVSSNGLPTIINKTIYDDKGRFALKATNSLNQTTMIVNSIDKKWGKPLSITDIAGNTTVYEYNGFGEIKKTTDSQGNISTVQKIWDITNLNNSTSTIPSNTLFYSLINSTNKPYSKTWYDVLGRQVKSEIQTQNGGLFTVNKFDKQGNLATSTSPFLTGSSSIITTTNSYDVYNRLTNVTNGISTTTYSYAANAGKITTTTVSPAQTTSQIVDASGKVISSTDKGGTLLFSFYSSGLPKNTTLGTSTLVKIEYDQYGNQTKLIDADAGTTVYEYNAYKQLISQTDANNKTYQLQYDVLGRQISKTGPDGVTSSTFITSGNGINQTQRTTGPNGAYFNFTYDKQGRVISEVNFIDGQSFTTSYEYNSSNTISSIKYPSGYKIKLFYSAIGDVNKVTDENGTVDIFSLPTTNEKGQYTSYKLGNNKTTNLTYDAFGFIKTIVTSGVQNYEVQFNQSTGNVDFRKEYTKDRNEIFTYDALNRLSNSTVQSILNPQLSGTPLVVNYGSNGNIINKTDVGSYRYDLPNKTHAVTSVENPVENIPSLNQDVTYTPFDRTATITEGINSITFKYGPDCNRIKSELYASGSLVKTKYFIGGYEKEVTPTGTKEIHYIPTGNGSNAVYVIDKGVAAYYYLYKDHLGSVNTVTNNTGIIVYEQNFDAWGRKRNPTSWNYSSITPTPSQFSWLRGFTGHEHLEEFGLINMNNRMYDPLLARMLAVDNFVQNPYNSQNYNRYSYVMNNPLAYTDPDGEIAVAAMIIGGVIGGISGWKIGEAKGATGWKMFGYISGGTVIGALSGGYGAGFASSGSIAANTFGMIASSGASSTGMCMLSGGTTDFTVSMGFASYNATQQEWGQLGKKGNSELENGQFALGMLSNISDAIMIADNYIGVEKKLQAKCDDLMNQWETSHPNAIPDPESLSQNCGRSYPSYLGKNIKYTQNGIEGDYLGHIPNMNWKEYAGYLHDMEYVNKDIMKGAKSLMASYETYGADIRLMSRTLYLGLKYNSSLEIVFGGLIGVVNVQKSIYGYLVKP